MFCNVCGKNFRAKKNYYGNACVECKKLRHGHKLESGRGTCFCVTCGVEIPTIKTKRITKVGVVVRRPVKFCENCTVLSMDQRKCRIHGIVNKNKENLSILYECPCKTIKKVHHHFDYTRPLEVIKLCTKCRGKEHSRINKIKKMKKQK